MEGHFCGTRSEEVRNARCGWGRRTEGCLDGTLPSDRHGCNTYNCRLCGEFGEVLNPLRNPLRVVRVLHRTRTGF